MHTAVVETAELLGWKSPSPVEPSIDPFHGVHDGVHDGYANIRYQPWMQVELKHMQQEQRRRKARNNAATLSRVATLYSQCSALAVNALWRASLLPEQMEGTPGEQDTNTGKTGGGQPRGETAGKRGEGGSVGEEAGKAG